MAFYILYMKKKLEKSFESQDVESIKRNIALYRKKKGLTQSELAQKMGVTQRVISYYENEANNIGLDAITTIARALEISVKKILDSSSDVKELPKIPNAIQKRIDRVKDLSPKSQKTLSDMIDVLLKAEANEK
jgi:transcriptional regulator with XRE-family HTH domain